MPAEASTLLDQLEFPLPRDPEGFSHPSVMPCSAFRFLTFLTEILNEVSGRAWDVVVVKWALLWLKKGNCFTCICHDGVDEAFLGQDKGQRYDSYYDWNEGNQRIAICLKSWALKWKISINTQISRSQETGLTWRECPPKSWTIAEPTGKNSLSGWFRLEGDLGRLTRSLVSLLQELVRQMQQYEISQWIGHVFDWKIAPASVPYDPG